ncbi:MAG: hypothetical protein QM817_30005 [Archangium sp.]
MTRTLWLAALSLSVLSACGVGSLPMEAPAEPTRVPTTYAASTNPPQRFALTSASENGWSLSQHAAVAPGDADFTMYAAGCRGVVTFEIISQHFNFCRVGTGFTSVTDVPTTPTADCYTPYSFAAGGSDNRRAIGDGYVVLKDGEPYGQLLVVDHTLVPESWDGTAAQVTLDFTSQRATP